VKGWKRRAADRPDELARAALELCAERGVQGTRVADVAERAGVTVGTVYRYFRDKDALIDAALKAPPRPASRTGAADARPGSSLPRLAETLRRWNTFFRGDGARSVRVALSDPRRHPAGPMTGLGDAVRELTAVIADGAESGDFRRDLTPAVVAQLLAITLAAGAVVTDAQDDDDDAVVDALVALATRGLRADGPSWRA
jgi:AcrR family transcriptional regulator